MGCFGFLEASVGPSLKVWWNFTGSDLAEGQLSDRLCKTMDSGVFDRSRSLHSTDKVVYRFVGGLRLQGIQLVFTVLPPWSRTGMWWCGEDHWPVEKLVDRRSNGNGHHG